MKVRIFKLFQTKTPCWEKNTNNQTERKSLINDHFGILSNFSFISLYFNRGSTTIKSSPHCSSTSAWNYFHTNTEKVGKLDRARDYGFKFGIGQKGQRGRGISPFEEGRRPSPSNTSRLMPLSPVLKREGKKPTINSEIRLYYRCSLKLGFRGLPWWLSGKESTYQCRRHVFNP